MATSEVKGFVGKYAYLSNFYAKAPFVLDGYEWLSTEHYYQAQKAINDDDFHKIRLAKTPGKTKAIAKKVDLRLDWEAVKIPVMRKCVEAKFRQNPDLAKKLLDTKDKLLEETNDWGDVFWGVCNSKGKNWLGVVLMDLRTKLRMEQFGL